VCGWLMRKIGDGFSYKWRVVVVVVVVVVVAVVVVA